MGLTAQRDSFGYVDYSLARINRPPVSGSKTLGRPAMQTTSRATVATLFGLLLGFGLMQMGNTFQGTLLSIRGGIEGFTAAQIGAVGSGFWAGIVIGSLRCGRWIQKIGHIRAFLALGAIASTAPLVHLLAIHPISWVVARALTGFCTASC